MKFKSRFSTMILLMATLSNGAVITAVSTYNNIGLEVQSAQTDTIKVQYKESTASSYQNGHFLSRTDASNHAGSLFMLKAGTAYTIKLTLTTGDTTITVATRPDTIAKATGTVYHVSPGGNDANNGTSLATAFRTIGKAVETAQAGNTVLLHSGVYHEEVTLPRSGTASAPIVIRNAPGEHPVLDGRDTSFFKSTVTWEVYNATKKIYRAASIAPFCRTAFYRGNHVFGFNSAWYDNEKACFDDMISNPYNAPYYATVYNGYLYIRCPNGATPQPADSICLSALTTAITCSRNYIQIIGLEICYYANDQYSCAVYMNPGSYNLIDSCYFHHNITGVQIKGACNYNTIQHLKNNESNLDEFSWSSIKEGNHDYEAGAIYVMNSNSGTTPNIGNVIRYCDFEHQFDCAHLFSSGANGATKDMDFHDNRCWYSGDDGIETDGYGVNVRIYNNHFKRGLTGISIAPSGFGPVYIFRNVISGWNTHDEYTGYPIKMNYGDDCIKNVFFYHNTCFTGFAGQPALWFKIENQIFSKFTCKNNIFAGTDLGIRNDLMADSCVTMDYDDIYTSGSTYIEWRNKTYSTIAAFSTATGLEAHGLNKVKPEFTDTVNDDFTLISTSLLIDKGVPIPGINNDYKGLAPDIGRYEQGELASVYSGKPISALKQALRFYNSPNPFVNSTNFHLENDLSPAMLRIYNIQSRLVYEKPIKAGTRCIVWRVGDRQKPGVYIAKLFDGDTKVLAIGEMLLVR